MLTMFLRLARLLLLLIVLSAVSLRGSTAPAREFGTNWTANYYNNPSLQGVPVYTETLPTGINVNWGTGSPNPAVAVDNWSARFTSTQVFNAGGYEFVVSSDDGVRVFVDGILVWDRWIGRVLTTDRFQLSLTAGTHTLTVEYMELVDQAALQFQYFQVALPFAPILSEPNGSYSAGIAPIYRWYVFSGAEWYYLWVTGGDGHVFNQWVQAESICNAILCTYQPGTTPYDPGSYTWWVQAWGSTFGYSQWSNSLTYYVNFSGIPVQIAPSGVVEANPLTFQWQTQPSADWYELWISSESGLFLDQWLPAASICTGATCSVPYVTVGDGIFRWWVRAYANNGVYSGWSSEMRFIRQRPLESPVPSSPIGTVTTESPTFSWNDVAGADWYYLWVSGDGFHVLDRWMSAGSICSGGICIVHPSSFANGNYQYWLQAWSSIHGYGAWSPAYAFTVAMPLPGDAAPALELSAEPPPPEVGSGG